MVTGWWPTLYDKDYCDLLLFFFIISSVLVILGGDSPACIASCDMFLLR